MKKIWKVLFIVLVSFGMIGCTSTNRPIDHYYAIIYEMYDRMDYELLYMEDDKKFNEEMTAIEELKKRSSEIELTATDDLEAQPEIDQSAEKLIETIKEARPIIIKSIKLQEKDDYSYVDKENEMDEKFYNAHSLLEGDISKILVSTNSSGRREYLDFYYTSSSSAISKTEAAINNYYILTIEDNVSDKEIDKLNKLISEGREELDDIKTLKIEKEDLEVREYIEEKIEEALDQTEDGIKYLKNQDIPKINKKIRELKILEMKIDKDIYYNIDIKPYLNFED
ncbi:hypothetical protein LJB88_05450 [Erysipelotrichaceae bacterium OttesenSCG-928-M19]|nr:hypothetical protein [Erysipelotrichaceae bacterium OttesenSCG-928-M19]